MGKRRLIFILLAVLLLTPWPVAFAYDAGDSDFEQNAVQIDVAEASATPSWNVFGRAIGGVTTPGDLFYIDATGNTVDLQVTLYLTNTQQLIYCYRYLILEVGVYVEGETNQWQKASCWDGELIPDIYITLLNGRVQFTLPGDAKYKVTIDNGCFYSIGTNVEGGSVSPRFYLTADYQ